MKKSTLVFLMLVCVTLNSPLFALSCKNLFGIWKGNLSPLTSVSLSIHKPDLIEDAMISFTDPSNVHIEYGMLHGNCQKEADGSILIRLARHAYGANVILIAKLNDKNQLIVTEFAYGDTLYKGNGRGLLEKLL